MKVADRNQKFMPGIKGNVVVLTGVSSEGIRERAVEQAGYVKARKKRQRAAAFHLASEWRARELWLSFVALFVCPGCLTHLIVLRFGDAFFEHLRTLAPSLGIFIFSEGVCCLPSG